MATGQMSSSSPGSQVKSTASTLLILAFTVVWGGFWTIVAIEIYQQRQALGSGLGGTAPIAAVATLLLIFVVPVVYVGLRRFAEAMGYV